MSLYVHYGCGLIAPEEWINFDASPTLRLQKIPLIGGFFKKKVNFPSNVKYGNIVKGLPGIHPESCDGIYCSHVLEHLTLNDFRKALKNTYTLLKPGGIFRCVLPSLEFAAYNYIDNLKRDPSNASLIFMEKTLLGIKQKPKGIRDFAITYFGNSHHLWMWDRFSLEKELYIAGFFSVRQCFFKDSVEARFNLLDIEGRFGDAVSFECLK